MLGTILGASPMTLGIGRAYAADVRAIVPTSNCNAADPDNDADVGDPLEFQETGVLTRVLDRELYGAIESSFYAASFV
jgi:hypothetical protein